MEEECVLWLSASIDYGGQLREYGDNGTCHELKLRLLEKGGRSMSSYGGDIGGFEVSQRLPSTGNPFATL
uniref:Uncharacterized protein n=1 Tax=Oryza barthii TaxID=65489 RepID=A0A0D3G3A7_9ORYZ